MSSTLAISEQIRAPIARQLDLLEADLAQAFTSEIGLVSAIGEHLVAMKGKRIRPTLVLLSAGIGSPDQARASRVALAVERAQCLGMRGNATATMAVFARPTSCSRMLPSHHASSNRFFSVGCGGRDGRMGGSGR